MRHYLFALFEGPQAAANAVRELEQVGTDRRRCSVLTHERQLRSEELPTGETRLRDGVVGGAVLGGALGALFGGLVLGPLGLAGAGVAFTTALTATAGTIEGALFAGLASSSVPDRKLEAMAAELARGKVLLSVETPDQACLERAEQVLLAAGGRVEHRPTL